MNKFEFVRDLLVDESRRGGVVRPSILDVGCRECALREYLAPIGAYDGMDLYQNSSNSVRYVADLSKSIPVNDATYDYSVALDVVEHVDDMQLALDELVRVSARAAFVMLPNLAHIMPRVRFLTTGRFSEKYDIGYPTSEDRHRWFTVQAQCDSFMQAYAKSKNLTLRTEWYMDGPRKARLARLMRSLGLSPSLWVWASLYVLRKQAAPAVVP